MIRLPRQPDLWMTNEILVSEILRILGDAVAHKCCVLTIKAVRGYTPQGHQPNPKSLGVEIRCGSQETFYVPASRDDSEWTLHSTSKSAGILHILAEVMRQCQKDPEVRTLLRNISERDVDKTGLRRSDVE